MNDVDKASKVGDQVEPGFLSTKSLASTCMLSMNYSYDGSNLKDTQWYLVPISQISQRDDAPASGVGMRAIDAMMSDISSEENYRVKLSCSLVGSQNVVVTVETKDDDERSKNDDKELDDLIGVIARVMVQNVLKKLYSNDLSKTPHEDTNIIVTIPSSKNALKSVTMTYTIGDILSVNGFVPLFEELLPSDTNPKNVEMSDMVDGNGEPLGYVPRPLIHKFNLLHRGIGIVVCRDSHLTKENTSMPDIYVHRRTDTKRIFPSLYDMFVGGVSTAGEDLSITAQREISEELGLIRQSLSDPLFKCTVCTSYNRCVVTVFTYKCDISVDEIIWQEEEVSWGNFVSYAKVKKAGALSLIRLHEAGEWPGRDTDVSYVVTGVDDFTSLEDEDDKWDFVPDGLLVWVAWLKWMSSPDDS